MTLSNSIFAVSGAATFLDARKDMSNLFACDTSLEPHPGLLTVGGSSAASGNVVVGMSNRMAVTVRPFQAVLNRLGALLIMNDGDVVVPLQAAPSANSRIDVVYVKQRERRAPISDSEDGPIIGVVTGTANLTPVAPQVPDGAVALAQVKVPSGVTNTTAGGVVITQVYPFAATRGEELRFRSKGDMDAFAALDGTRAVTLSDNAHYVRNAGAWKPVFETVHESWQGGSISVIYGESSCMVQVTSVKIGSGSWESVDWGKKISEAYRPKYEISNPLMVANGASHTGFLVVTAGGVVSVKNMGASGSSDHRNGSVCWPVERRY